MVAPDFSSPPVSPCRDGLAVHPRDLLEARRVLHRSRAGRQQHYVTRTEQIRVADLSPDGLLAVLAEVANLPPSQPVPEVRSHYPSLAWHAFMMSMNSSWLMVSANTAKRST